MVRNSLIGMIAFGLVAALAGYVWTTFEFPFAIVLPAMIGAYAVTRSDFGNRKALVVGLLGGVVFTGALMVAMFLAIADSSPLPIAGWLGALLAAALAGAVVGAVLGHARGAVVMAAFSAAGMLAAIVALSIMRAAAPASVDVEGAAQAVYFSTAIGVVGALVGLAAGAGTAWIAGHRVGREGRGAGTRVSAV